MLQCVAVCCSVLQTEVAHDVDASDQQVESTTRCNMWCSVLQYVAVCCSVLQCVAVCCSVLQCAISRLRNNLARAAEFFACVVSVLQCVAVSCRVLQCVAVRSFKSPNYLREMTRPYVCHDAFICATRRISMCNMTYFYTQQVPHCHSHDMTHLRVRSDSLYERSAVEPFMHLKPKP